MARTPIRNSANDNQFPIRQANDASSAASEELTGAGCLTGEDMVIIRDPVSGEWLIEDYAGEAVLFHMPRGCSLDEGKRAAAVYAAAFKSGFEQGRFVAQSTSILR